MFIYGYNNLVQWTNMFPHNPFIRKQDKIRKNTPYMNLNSLKQNKLRFIQRAFRNPFSNNYVFAESFPVLCKSTEILPSSLNIKCRQDCKPITN